MMRHETQESCGVTARNEQTADMYTRNEKKYWSCSFILIRIDTILSKNIWNNFQNLLFKKLLTQSGDQTDVFWKFYLPTDTFWFPKTIGRVLGHTNDTLSVAYCTFKHAASTERDWSKYVHFQQSASLTNFYCRGVHNWT